MPCRSSDRELGCAVAGLVWIVNDLLIITSVESILVSQKGYLHSWMKLSRSCVAFCELKRERMEPIAQGVFGC